MLKTRLHWLPVIIALCTPLSLFITYFIAVLNTHVKPGFPYVSDTATTPPESCIFSQCIHIGVVTTGFILYIRYCQIAYHCEKSDRRYLLYLNTAAFVCGLIQVFGLSLAANFQVTNVQVVHFFGAFLVFTTGCVYMILQTIISCKSISFKIPGNTVNIRRCRKALCIADVSFSMLALIPGYTSSSKGPGPDTTRQQWTSDDPGYVEHLMATISEWLVVFIIVGYYATFYKEFKQFRMRPPEVIYYKKQQRTEIAVVS